MTEPSASTTQTGSSSGGSQSPPKEQRYSLEDLQENPRLVGPEVNRHGIAAALAGDDRQSWTLDQVKKAVKRLNEPLDNQPAELAPEDDS